MSMQAHTDTDFLFCKLFAVTSEYVVLGCIGYTPKSQLGHLSAPDTLKQRATMTLVSVVCLSHTGTRVKHYKHTSCRLSMIMRAKHTKRVSEHVHFLGIVQLVTV